MSYDLWTMPDGNLLRTHGPVQCRGQFCSLHNPSPHHMRMWPLNWREDRALMERVCMHGVGHPDPDDIAYKHRCSGSHYAETAGVHGCDGCCSPGLFTKLPPQEVTPTLCDKTKWAVLAFVEWVKSFFRK